MADDIQLDKSEMFKHYVEKRPDEKQVGELKDKIDPDSFLKNDSKSISSLEKGDAEENKHLDLSNDELEKVVSTLQKSEI